MLDELNKLHRVDPPNFKVAYAFTAIPARYTLERRQWKEAADLALPQANTGTAGGSPAGLQAFPWQQFRWATAHIHFDRAIGAARSGDMAAARKDLDELALIYVALVQLQAKVKGDYDWARQVEIEHQVASAWLTHANDEGSVRLMRAAADSDDRTDKHPVTPGSILPAREQLGELLLELKQPAAALQEFETSLRNARNRFNGLYGAARAARLAGDEKKAKTYYGKVLELCRHADSTRPEIEEVKAFVAGVNPKHTASKR